MSIKVLEVDQWTSTGNITDFSFDDYERSKVSGGDSDAALKLFGGTSRVKYVSETDRPSVGNVWFNEGPTGKLVLYKANYDSSD